MKGVVSTILLILIIVQVYAQENIFSENDVFNISLQNKKVKIENFNYSIEEVIDQRLNKYLIGSVQIGTLKRRFPANFEKPLEEEFQSLIKNSRLNKKDKEKIVLIVNSLWIDERTGSFNEKGMAEINFYIAKRVSEGLMILSEQEIFYSKNVRDATFSHDKRIKEVIEMGLTNFSQLAPNNYVNQLFKGNKYSPDSSIVKTKKVKRGVYMSPMQLLNNDPEKNFKLKYVKYLENNAIALDTLENKIAKKIFAFSDGKDIYINSLCYGNISSIFSEDNKIQFGKAKLNGTIIKIKDRITNTEAQLLMAFAFGIAGSIASSEIKKEGNFFLDLRKGAVMPINQKFVLNSLQEFPNLLDNYLKLPKNQKNDIEILSNFIDKMNVELEK